MTTELEKLDRGEWYHFLDAGVAKRKARAAQLCQEFIRFQQRSPHVRRPKLRKSWGQLGKTYRYKRPSIAIMVATSTLGKISLVITT